MKKSIIAILIYILTLHVILPAIYYCFQDVMPLYGSFIDLPSFIKAFLLILTSLGLSIIWLWILPTKEGDIVAPNINGRPITELFYLSVLFKLILFYYAGGFSGVLAGKLDGTFGRYLSLFLDPFFLLLTILFAQTKRSKVVKAVLFYVLSVTLSGSRSGVLAVFFVFLIGYAFSTFPMYKKKIYDFLRLGLLLSPALFVFGTIMRDMSIDYRILGNLIVARLSTLETAMWPIYFRDHNLGMQLFDEKYSFLNQMKIVLDSILPGSIFTYDINPNNYYRAIFFGASLDYVRENYMSINMTLPIYLYTKYGYLGAFCTILYVYGFYKITRFFKSSPLVVIALLSTFYNLIYFFDFVMLFAVLYSSLLTILSVKIYIILRREFLKGPKGIGSIEKQEFL